jgi:hypothetical protein
VLAVRAGSHCVGAVNENRTHVRERRVGGGWPGAGGRSAGSGWTRACAAGAGAGSVPWGDRLLEGGRARHRRSRVGSARGDAGCGHRSSDGSTSGPTPTRWPGSTSTDRPRTSPRPKAMVDAAAYAAKTADPNESRTLDQLEAPGWSTSASNLGVLCPSCHNAKTHAGWHLEQPEPGRFTWRAPTGHRYDLGPEPIGPHRGAHRTAGRPTRSRTRLGPAPVLTDLQRHRTRGESRAFAASLRTLRSARAA